MAVTCISCDSWLQPLDRRHPPVFLDNGAPETGYPFISIAKTKRKRTLRGHHRGGILALHFHCENEATNKGNRDPPVFLDNGAPETGSAFISIAKTKRKRTPRGHHRGGILVLHFHCENEATNKGNRDPLSFPRQSR